MAVLHQVDQRGEHLWLDGNRFGTAVKLAPLGIKGVIGKAKLHVVAPVGLRGPRPTGIIKPISRTNQAPGKVFPSRSRYPPYFSIAILVIATEHRKVLWASSSKPTKTTHTDKGPTALQIGR
jgi:hypothetical protein